MKNLSIDSIQGCISILDRAELPARFVTIGGQSFAVGTKIKLHEVVEMSPVEGSNSTKNWFGVASEINGAVQVLGVNTLLGIIFEMKDNKQKRTVIENGLTDKTIKDLLGKTIEVTKLQPYKAKRFGTDEIIERNAPVFKIVEGE